MVSTKDKERMMELARCYSFLPTMEFCMQLTLCEDCKKEFLEVQLPRVAGSVINREVAAQIGVPLLGFVRNMNDESRLNFSKEMVQLLNTLICQEWVCGSCHLNLFNVRKQYDEFIDQHLPHRQEVISR